MSCSVLKRDHGESLPHVAWRLWPAGASAPDSASVGPGGTRSTAVPAGSSLAPADAARLEKDAYERGFRDGEASATRKAAEQLQSVVRGFAETAVSVASYKSSLRREAEQELTALAMAIAGRIVRRELSLDPGIILSIVRSCLGELGNGEVYRVRLHPHDAQAVGAYLAEQRRTEIEVVPDTKIGRGGALFETSQGRLDARIGTQLDEIELGLADQ